MPFIGKTPTVGNFILLDAITVSNTATFALTKDTLDYYPGSAQNMIVSVNGVTQAPLTAYTITDSNITFSSALDSDVDVIDYILVLGDTLNIGRPSDSTVGATQLQDYAVTSVKMSNTGVSAATYGTSTSIPQITIDAAGRITSATGIDRSNQFEDLTVTGNLTVSGNTVTVDAQTLSVEDPLIHLAANNETSDVVDIGFVGHYSNDGGTTKLHTGFFRDASDEQYYLFNGFEDDNLDLSSPTTTIDRTANTFTLADLNTGRLYATVDSNIVASFTSTTTTAKITISDANDAAFIDVNATRLGIGHSSSTSLQALQIEPTSAEAMRIANSGNVGIGNDSPVHELDILANATATLRIANETDSTAQIILRNVGTADGTIRQVGGDMFFDIGGNEKVALANDGSLGIGVTAPTARLDVREEKTGGGVLIQVYNTDNSDTTTQTAGLALGPDSRGGTARITAVKENADFSTNAGRDVALTFSSVLNNSPTERMRIDSDGNVKIVGGDLQMAGGYIEKHTSELNGYIVGGYNSIANNNNKVNPIYAIGNAYTPSSETSAGGGFHGIGFTRARGSGGGTSYFQDLDWTLNTGWGLYGMQAGTARWFLDASNGDINWTGKLGHNGTVVMDASRNLLNIGTISSTGNVGIGTNAPTTARVEVASATGYVGFNYGTSSSPERGNLWYDTDGTGWVFNIGKMQSGSFTSQLTIKDDGAIGIGQTNPTSTLDIAGSQATVTVTSSSTQGVLNLINSTAGYKLYASDDDFRIDDRDGFQNRFAIQGTTGWIGINNPTPTSQVHITATDTTADASKSNVFLDVNMSGSDTLTADRTHRGMFIDVDSTATGGDTSNEHRIHGLSVDVRATGDSDLMYGSYSYAESQHSAGTITQIVGALGYAVADDTGTGRTTNIYGLQGLAYSYNTGTGGTTNQYGCWAKALLTTSTDKDTATATGVYGEVEYDNPGQPQTLNAGYAFQAQIDNDSAGNVTVTNGYLYYGNYAGAFPTNAYGVYIIDAVDNYFAGDLDVGGTKNFQIKHPLPALANTHNLVHTVIEAPSADNIYSGMIHLVGGSATINIDTEFGMTEGTFVALNRNVRRSVTNEEGFTAVKCSLNGNILTITAQDNTCTDEVFWMVIGQRQDEEIKASNKTDADGYLILEPEYIEHVRPINDDPNDERPE